MRRYRFIVFDENKLVAETRDFPAMDDSIAVQVADGWRDVRGAQLWRGRELIRRWRRGTGRLTVT